MKLTRRQLRRMIAEEKRRVLREAAEGGDGLSDPLPKKQKSKKPLSEMQQLASGRNGRTLESAGRKVINAARQIESVADGQTGQMAEALSKLAEFYTKMGDAAAGVRSLNEGQKMSETLPNLQELSDLQKELAKLE